jgi:hypothetical protein
MPKLKAALLFIGQDKTREARRSKQPLMMAAIEMYASLRRRYSLIIPIASFLSTPALTNW